MLELLVSFFHFLTTTQFCVPGPCPPSPDSHNPWIFPLILVWWSVGLTLIALVAAGHLFWVTRELHGSFLRLVEVLRRGRIPGHLMTRTVFEQVDDALRTKALTSEGWDEFKETILREEKGETGEVVIFNTRTAAEFFPYSTVEQRISAFHRLMPVTLTSAGLLGTFLALLLGLHAVHVPQPPTTLEGKVVSGATSPADVLSSHQPALPQQSAKGQTVEGVEDLVNALSGKFLSSIVALFLSILYGLGEAWRLRQVARAHHQFCSAFDALFVRKTPESYLQKILEETERQSAAFRHFNTDLSGYLKQSFQESLGPTLDRLTDTLERLTSTNEERMAQLIGSLSETFRSNLTESAQTEFQQLAQALQQTAGLLQAMNQQSRATQEGLETLLVRLDESQRQQTSAAEAQRKTTEDLFAQIARQVQEMAEQNNSNLEQTVNRLLERTASWSNDTATSVTRVLTDHARLFEEKMETLLARLDTIVGEMGRSTQSGTENLLTGVGHAVAQLQETVASVSQTMKNAAAGVLQQTGDASAQFRENIEQVMTKLLESLSDSSKAATTDMAGIFVEHARMFEGRTKTLLERLNETATEMRQSSQAGSNRLSATTNEIAERLERVVNRVVNTMEGASAGMARQTGEVSAQLSEQIRQLLTQQFQQMRSTQAAYESLDQATKRLRDLVKDSGEAFGQVQPLISDLVATTRDLRSVGEVARNAHRELQQITNSFAQQGQFLQQTTTSHKAILDEFSKVFDRVSQGLGGILRQIGEEMQRYQERSRESLSLHLQEFDKHLASATQHIKVSVEGIGPGLEALAEAIDAAAKRIGSNGGRR
ncbi:MAG TPA: hypothetical protein VNN62_27185 [Methylomirabilota bacterium]|nr:hypothetical protein [Methylomirabilota bacterium]